MFSERNFLACPAGVSAQLTGGRKCSLMPLGVRRLSCMTSGHPFDSMTSVLTSFSTKRFVVNVADRSRTKHFLTKNYGYF